MRTMKKVSMLICFLGLFSFVFSSSVIAKNSERSNGPKWKVKPSLNHPEKPGKPDNPEEPNNPKLDPPEDPAPPILTPPTNKGPRGVSGPAGKSKTGHLYLYEKVEGSWEIVEDGAWGKMTYPLEGPTFKFVFNGHGLEPKTDYTLIYYPDPWPGTGLICLGSATSNGGGNVHIMGSPDTGSLPTYEDLNNPDADGHTECVDTSTCIEGAKIWLVLSSDVDCDSTSTAMTGWNPTEYLFEDVGIVYVEP
ncbi:MAG TPA: hypothetical protein VLK23_17920 [Thermodesulfobacteriota bacterium]|nr:hypothetical protein [Thermodesulfobacteriota bacterium]